MKVEFIRPLKLISLICSCIALLLIIIAISTTFWVETTGYREGLWRVCYHDNHPKADQGCVGNHHKAWVQACAALCILSMLFTLAGIICTILGLLQQLPEIKMTLYKIAIGVLLFAALLLLLCLIVFPSMFMKEIRHNSHLPNQEWYFGWDYGVGWGSFIFMVAAAVLIFIDLRNNEESYYDEREQYENTQYNSQQYDQRRY